MKKIIFGVLVVVFSGIFLKSKSVPLPSIEFYKGVSLALNASESDFEQAKNLGANIVDFGLNGLDDLQNLASQVKIAHKNGLHVALTFFFSPKKETKDPQEWLKLAKPLYHKLGEFAAKNNIYLIIVPGEIETITGATCCSHDPSADLIPTANNELSAKGFAFWSQKISHELRDELRKNFRGRVAAIYIAGNWWFEGRRLVGPSPWKMEGFDALVSGIQFDDPGFIRDVAGVSHSRASVLKEIAKRSRVNKVIFEVPPINPMLEYNRGQGFSLADNERQALYQLFFQETHTFLQGYFLPKFPPPHYDPVAFAVGQDWYNKLP